MAWKKLGLIFDISKHSIPWLKSHAMLPTPLILEDRIRVYYSGRDFNGESRVSFVDTDISDPSKILYVHDRPVLDIGGMGTFDDSGTLATCAVKDENLVYIYYTAYSRSFKVPYRNAIGMAVSTDNGKSFTRLYNGPIVDRSREEPFFTISPWVIHDGNTWHMWYASATEWILVNNKPESLYHIKYASSENGKDWKRTNQSCILPLEKEEANAKPSVIKEDGLFKMWFCYRGSKDFRDGIDSYKIGYAEASESNPAVWTRDDSKAGIAVQLEEYESKMQAYPSVITVKDKKFIFYNGNGFGYSGFACAEWVSE